LLARGQLVDGAEAEVVQGLDLAVELVEGVVVDADEARCLVHVEELGGLVVEAGVASARPHPLDLADLVKDERVLVQEVGIRCLDLTHAKDLLVAQRWVIAIKKKFNYQIHEENFSIF